MSTPIFRDRPLVVDPASIVTALATFEADALTGVSNMHPDLAL
ncbi:MAG: hypothetical protein AAGA08_16805 [Pseudomonadota bacterium]